MGVTANYDTQLDVPPRDRRFKTKLKRKCHLDKCHHRFEPKSRWDIFCPSCKKYNPHLNGVVHLDEMRVVL